MIQNRILMWGILSTSVAALLTLATLSPALTTSQQAGWVAKEVALAKNVTPMLSETRATPNWWSHAKFGVFIRWSSLPADANTDLEAHIDSDPDGPALRPAAPLNWDSFDSDQWAQTLYSAGAKYVVMPAKLDNGYCLWPSEHADIAWERPWCTASCASHRDLLGELAQSVRENEMKLGIHFAHDDGSNPLFSAGVKVFVGKHLAPQFKDVVTKYRPSVVISESKCNHPVVKSETAELLSWLVAVPQCKKEVVINDRSMISEPSGYGGYTSCKYGESNFDEHTPWEANHSIEITLPSLGSHPTDADSGNALTLMLIDVVARGGNFLLDVTPAADGRIPESSAERLAAIGRWLTINGEAIFGTTVHQEHCQWSGGVLPDLGSGVSGIDCDVNKIQRGPDSGLARKEVLFTRNAEILYAICPLYPNQELTLKGIVAPATATVTMLGYDIALNWQQTADGLVIETPEMPQSKLSESAAWTFRISEILL